jgi:CNT family concentrative nucleoside transporter
MLDAISVGTSDGMMLAANVAAMLIAFISIIALFDSILGAATNAALGTAYSLKDIFALIFWPLAQLIGIPASEAKIAGSLLGTKLVVNEFVAYAEMLKESLSPRSVAIITYALCGFSNFSCIGIQIGGIGALCPEKRATLTKLGLTALLGGTLTNLLSAAIAGLLL